MAIEGTFVMVKPDETKRALAGEVISRLQQKGLRLDRIKRLVVDEETAHRPYEELFEKPVLRGARVLAIKEPFP